MHELKRKKTKKIIYHYYFFLPQGGGVRVRVRAHGYGCAQTFSSPLTWSLWEEQTKKKGKGRIAKENPIKTMRPRL
jgi:hypothetical protein